MSQDEIEDYIPEVSIIEKIEVLRTVLGSMVMMPQYEKNPNDIGAKSQFTGTIQQPIIMDDNRDIVENKLIELVKQL